MRAQKFAKTKGELSSHMMRYRRAKDKGKKKKKRKEHEQKANKHKNY